ncbi:mechanosensitive ion channel [Paraneptunicella aestuarii]|uniref:mechanosensitive ion channel family protein n=1 Tax=Paraneptunicella aestuarii TaxID=2831148 RepID=UPI001E5030E0|nr:mechanosensitive ion channel domain-containing protein [Paraneptunicella aestuarii]UAA39246.1 mechanosensitive ion channel [Paraneptunicella aestuarii]
MQDNYLSEYLVLWLKDWQIAEAYYEEIYQITALFCLLIAAMLTFHLSTLLLDGKLRNLILKTKNKWDDSLIEHGFFLRLNHAIPAIFINVSSHYLFKEDSSLQFMLETTANIYLILTITGAINALINTIQDGYNGSDYAKRVPIEGFIQVAKLAVTVIAVLLVVAQIMDKSPALLLSGLGALTAVLLLVFKDTILGFVAGINIIANRTVNTGDWIEMPKYSADGNVLEIGLTTVKVQNWDNTISTIPTYALMTESVKNWRGMQESGGRRIKRGFNMDIQTIKACDSDMLSRLAQIHLLKDFLHSREQEITDFNKGIQAENYDPLNAQQITNLEAFRAYMEAYLSRHPLINKNMTLMVRQLPPTEHGLPIEMYCFSLDKAWVNYEKIQAQLMEHFITMLPVFDLRIYQMFSDLPLKSGD